MSTTRIKEKISAIVSSQLPEFVQNDFPTFVAFIEAYYRFLEQDQNALELVQNAKSYNNIDETTESFVQFFLKTYADRLPSDILVNKRFLVKRIKDLYESKGSELSFKLLFQLLFNSDVTVSYPFENVLRSSDGKWSQRQSLRIETVSGNRNNIINRTLTHTVNGVVYNTPILSVKNLTTSLTEVFLDPNLVSPVYTIGDTINVSDSSGIVFSGVIRPTTTTFSITNPGAGFKVGQIYTVNFGGAVETLVKISGVNSSGGITNLKFINYGYGFTTLFAVDFDPAKSVSETADILSSATQGFGSIGSVFSFDPLSPEIYFSEDYINDTSLYTFTGQQDFDTSTFVPAVSGQSKNPNFATITFGLGALGIYPGTFTTNDGFLSEPDVRLQDDQLYQPFAYLTNTEIDIDDFYDIVIELIHPAGQNLFNNRILNVDIDLSSNVSVIAESNISFEALSVVDIADLPALTLFKPVLGEDFVTLTDDDVVSVQKLLNNNTNLTDSGNAFVQSYFAENYVEFGYVEGSTFPIT